MGSLIEANVTIEGGTPKDIVKDMPRITFKALKASALLWREKYLPKHFQRGAVSRYGYQQRKPGYKASKRRRFGSITPLVATGQSRDQIKREKRRLRNIRKGTSKGNVRMPFSAPEYFFQFRKDHGAPDKAEEFLTLIRPEVDMMSRVASEEYSKGIERAMKRARRKKKVKKG